MNRVAVIGKLAEDPKQREFPSRVVCVGLRLRVKDKDHSYVLPVVLYGRDANSALRYLRKGSVVAIDGRVVSATRKSGGISVEIVSDRVEFLDGPPIREAEEKAV